MRPKSLLFPVLFLPAAAAHAIPEGFVIREFAKPPQVEYPTAVSVSPTGDVYVSSDKNGSLGHVPGYGKIVRATDTDGDGVADEFQDFVPDVESPRGGHFIGGTLYLIHPPYLSSFRDTTGDGVADEKKTLVKGFGWGIEHPRGADHTTNGVRMGIDGWLYVGVGDFGMPDAEGSDGTRYTLFGGGVVRVRPDGSEMEPYSLMTRNHFAPAISPYLDMFVRDNTNDGKGWNTRFLHFTALGNFGYPRLYQNFADEALPPLADYGGGAGTGGLYLHEPGFPGDYGDMVFTCDWTTGNVHNHPMKPFEATFVTGQETFHRLPRAIGLDVDGFSRLYLADWRDGGYSYGGPDKPVGRIHQVTAPGEKPASYRDVTKLADTELPPLLASRSAVQRHEAQREILARGRKPATGQAVFAIAANTSKPLYARVAAIFTLKQLDGSDSTPQLTTLAKDATVREFALRAMADRLSELDGVPVEPFVEALNDPNPRTRLQAAIGLSRLRAKEAAPALLAAAATWDRDPSRLKEGESYRLPHTAVKALAGIGNVEACLAAVAIPGQRHYALRALQEIHGEEAADGLIRLADSSSDADITEGVIGALARLYHVEKPWDLSYWWNTRPDDRGPYFEPVEWEATPRIKEVIERAYAKLPQARHAAVTEVLAKNRINVATLRLGELDPVVSALGAAALDNARIRTLLDAARDADRPWEQRIDCYRALSKAPREQVTPLRLAVLADWSKDAQAPAAATQARADFINETQRGEEVGKLRELAASQQDAASHIAWTALLTVRNSPLTKDKAKQAVQAAIDQNPREIGFFRALADLKLPGFDQQIEVGLNSDTQQLIDAAQAARDAAASVASGRKVGEMPQAEVHAYAMETKGDASAGARLYVAQGCIACHSVDLAAEQKGPYLGSAGSKFTRDYLIESILKPDAIIAQGFRSAVFQMNDGSAKMGFVTGEADGVVELRDITGQLTRIDRADVKEQQELPNSMMPAGLGDSLTIDEFTSLIEYMVSLRETGG